MREDFYVDEREMILAANKVFGMSNYYVATLEKYITIMTAVKDESINDEKICGEINDIITAARNYEIELQKLGDKFRNTIANELKAVEENSTFSFPTEPDLASIFAL